MKKYLLTTALALSLGAFGWTGSANADHTGTGLDFFLAHPNTTDASVEVTGHVDKEKDKYVIEFVFKLKIGLVVVLGVFRGNTAAESLVVVEQENIRNLVNHFPDGDGGAGVFLTANLIGSMNGNTGVTQLNVDVGNMVNQGNVLSASVSRTGTFADAVAAAEQFTVLNTSLTKEDPPDFTPANAQKRILVLNSVNRNRGVTQFNTNVGNMNNQLNAVSLAIGGDAGLALSESDLGQTTAFNTVVELSTIRTTTITNSMNGNTGITTGNVATGNMNNQATVISVAGSASF